MSIQEKEIIDFYLAPNPIKKTCAKFHIGETKLRKILNENNVHIRRPGEHCRKYEYDKDFFFKQSADLGYVLGLIAADGTIGSNDNRIEIELQEEDKEILEKIKQVIHLTRPIKIYNTQNQYIKSKLWIEDQKIKEQLVNIFHIPPRKTYEHDNFYFPKDSLNSEFWKDYIRGYFDGDGSVKDSNHTITFQIDGTNKRLIEEIRDIIKNFTNIQCQINVLQGINLPKHRIYAYGDNAKIIFNWFYDTQSSLYMKRKKEKYYELLMK